MDAPPGWTLATGLDPLRPGVFTAADDDTLVDAPIEASPELEVVTFEHEKATYEIVIHAPYTRYVFFFYGTNDGSGGLEHLNSTQITFGRYAQDNTDAYHRFQFVIAHEFYHLWNVKRIRPEVLGPFDYSRPQHTRNLFVSEGMTSYFAALSLVRSGVWDRATFYDDLAKNIQELQTQPGHLLTSAEMSSWLTWNRPDNSPNVTLNDRRTGAPVKLQVMRGPRLLTLPVTLQEDRKATYKIVEDPAASPAARALRDAWLRP